MSVCFWLFCFLPESVVYGRIGTFVFKVLCFWVVTSAPARAWLFLPKQALRGTVVCRKFMSECSSDQHLRQVRAEGANDLEISQWSHSRPHRELWRKETSLDLSKIGVRWLRFVDTLASTSNQMQVTSWKKHKLGDLAFFSWEMILERTGCCGLLAELYTAGRSVLSPREGSG